MSSNEQAAVEIEAKIREQHAVFRSQLAKFSCLFGSEATAEAKRAGLLQLVGQATDFFNLCEQSVADTSLLGAHRNETWVQNKAETSLTVLSTILETHETFDEVIPVLELPREAGRPPDMAYASLQRLVSMFFPERIDELRGNFLAARLPVVGFEQSSGVTEGREPVVRLLLAWRQFAEDLERAISSNSMGFVSLQEITGELSALESEGSRLIAAHASWLADQWIALTLRRQPHRGALERRGLLDVELPLGIIAAEVRERLVLLEAVKKEIDRSETHARSRSAHYFHVFTQEGGAKGAICNDLTEERLMTEIVEPLQAGKSIRIDGHAVTADCRVIKIARTDRDAGTFAREYDAQMRKRGISDLGTDRRRLPFEHGDDVTNQLLSPREPYPRARNTEQSPMASAKDSTETSNVRERDPHIPRWFPAAAFAVGVALVVLVLVLTTAVSNPSLQTYTLYRIVMAIGCAGFATALTGFIAIRMTFGNAIALVAGGSLAVFVIVYFWDPASGIARAPSVETPASRAPSSSAR